MSILSTTILAFSMSADAFAVAVAKGTQLQKPRLRDALRTGLIFGTVEGITPLIGWVLGFAASRYIQDIDHWVAFIILTLVGGKLIYEGLCGCENEEKTERHGLGLLIFSAIGTSIDALAVGVTLAFVDTSIWITAAAIGCATCLMVTIGIMTGHFLGCHIGKYAEVLGGVGLIAIGSHLLLSHLGLL